MVCRVGLAAIRNLDAIEIWARGLGQGKANTTSLLQSIDVLFALAASKSLSITVLHRLATPEQ